MQKSLDIRGSLGLHKLKSSKKLNAIFAYILSNIGSVLMKCNVVGPAKLKKFNESNIFQVSEIFSEVFGCVLLQLLMIPTLFSMQFQIRMKAK